MSKKLKNYQKDIIKNLPNKMIIEIPKGLGKTGYQKK